MNNIIEIIVAPSEIGDAQRIHELACDKAAVNPLKFQTYVVKSSIDARKRPIYRLQVQLQMEGDDPLQFAPVLYPKLSSTADQVVIVGAGPAGLFAALKLIEKGIKPIVLERGKDVKARRFDLAKLTKEHLVNPASNYCFGEGGAGTYSDGKLYTRSTKRGDVKAILRTLVQFGADRNILVNSHPHIGTNKLPQLIANMRAQILASGGEVLFETQWSGFDIKDNQIHRVFSTDGREWYPKALILATGHSARDVFEYLHAQNLEVQFKSFAMGVRAEHPQWLIDQQQYHCEIRPDGLPPAAYGWVEQVEGRGVYSFCMCPGGIIAPCATAPGEVVTNGWSPSKRNNPWANSGIVVPIEWEDIPAFHVHGPLAGLRFQQQLERDCWKAGGETQRAPAQRLTDFVQNKKSRDLPSCSYLPGVVSVNLHEVIPSFIAQRLKKGFIQMGRKMKHYLHEEAILVAPESRTSSPVRIPRDPQHLRHPQVMNLYPCGEGAGYAGGIISAAIDGERVAESVYLSNA
jgi:uncharacterized FAD-dependent dehydrogenase